MVNNKAVVGFIVILLLVIGGISLARRNPNFLSRFRGTSIPTKQNESVIPTPTNVQKPSNLTQCTSQVIAQCNKQIEQPICGWEKIVSSDGSETTRVLEYRNICSYCNLFGEDGVLDLGESKYYPLGYIEGSCGTQATK